jgi:hypothetical protein
VKFCKFLPLVLYDGWYMLTIFSFLYVVKQSPNHLRCGVTFQAMS